MQTPWNIGWALAGAGVCALLLFVQLYWRARLARHRDAVRRAEEFEILTHIGTALSSTLKIEDLLAAIHGHLGKLMDVRNFYVAFLEPAAHEIRFDFEVEDGERRLPRRRPCRRALTEHIIGTGQPLLIAGDIEAFCRAHDIGRSGRPARNYLGAPIFLNGRAQGVIAVQSPDSASAYDREHLRVLEIVAGQAAVALHNVSLFADAQRDAQQKEFLSNIARLTHVTLTPADMLGRVVLEIASRFAYPFVSVELPRDPEALPGASEFEISTSSGKPAPGRCGVSLPVQYAGQTLARLHIEAGERQMPLGFPRDQVMVLATLADQLAAALSHAYIFNQVRHQAITDSLTGLKTRRFFHEALQAEWRRARHAGDGFCIVLLDLNGFKPVNDTLGHVEGDRVLVRVGRLLEMKCRGSSVVARYGGDEFIILVPACDAVAAHQLPRRLADAMADDPVLAQRQVTGSFGLALYPESGATPEEMLRHADADMYRAKQFHHAARGPVLVRSTPAQW